MVRLPGKGEEGGGWREGRWGGRGGELALKSRFDFKSLFRPLNGDVINWQGFWDQFCLAIHENNSISDIDKFLYLKTFLCDSANATISGLSLSAANYAQAIELLKDPHGNSQVLISAYTEKLVLLPKIKNDDDISKPV